MMNQYNKETSQIHAPADLIRRTKEAVREEEQRIAREKLQPMASDMVKSGGVARPKRSYAKVYRWALPVAAAALCLIMLNVGVMRLGGDMSKMQSDTSMDMASGAASDSGSGDNGMGMQFGAAGMYEEAAEEPVGKSGAAFDTATGIVEQAAAADDAYESADYDGGQVAESGSGASAVSEESGSYQDSEYEEAENSYIESIYGRDLWIEEVEEVPSAYFYANTDTESIIIDGTVLYVAQDSDDTWIAYVKIGGHKYVVRGELTEDDLTLEEFAQKAYELLTDTTDRGE